MKKLALDLETLRVDSFATQDAGVERGTVRAHDDSDQTEYCTRERTCLIMTCVTLKACAAEEGDDAAGPR